MIVLLIVPHVCILKIMCFRCIADYYSQTNHVWPRAHCACCQFNSYGIAAWAYTCVCMREDFLMSYKNIQTGMTILYCHHVYYYDYI